MMKGWHGRKPAMLTSLCNHALAARMICWQQAFWTSLTELHSWPWKKEVECERQMKWVREEKSGTREVENGAEPSARKMEKKKKRTERGVETKQWCWADGNSGRYLRLKRYSPTSVSQTFNPLCSLTQLPLQGWSRQVPVPPFVFYFLKRGRQNKRRHYFSSFSAPSFFSLPILSKD